MYLGLREWGEEGGIVTDRVYVCGKKVGGSVGVAEW